MSTLNDFARKIIETPTLEAKLYDPGNDLKDSPQIIAFNDAPARPQSLAIVDAVKVPSPYGMPDPVQRSRILHAFANHELQAIELFARAILIYQNEPADFRFGLFKILKEEQKHLSLYITRLNALGYEFGDYPVNAYFWNKAAQIETPLQFLALMSLTFEGANLDHALFYRALALRADDHETAKTLQIIHDDEIGHVAFGYHWFMQFKDPTKDLWSEYTTSLIPPMEAKRAKARVGPFAEESRKAAGLPQDFIDRIKSEPTY